MQFDLNEKILAILHYQYQHTPEGRRLLVSGHFAHKATDTENEHIVLHRSPGVPVIGITEKGLLITTYISQYNDIKYDCMVSTREIYPVDGFTQTYMYEQKDWVLHR